MNTYKSQIPLMWLFNCSLHELADDKKNTERGCLWNLTSWKQ